MEKKFAHLHVHTEYSLLDGATRLNKLFKQCHKLNISAVAITDHGNMFGALEFAKQAVKFTDPKADFFEFINNPESKFLVKPIIGCEVYMTENMHEKQAEGGRMPKNNHLVLLAKDEKGYKNLVKLVSLGYVEGMYYKPRIDFETLQRYSDGLIALSACLAGVIPQHILGGNIEKADEWAKKYKELFGDDFYIEIQDHKIKDQKAVLPYLVDIARRNSIKLVATNDVHYLEKKDAFIQKILQCISFRRTLEGGEDMDDNGISGDGVEDGGYFPTKEFYLKDYDEMLSIFPSLEEALANTLEIADKCSCNFFKKAKLFPSYALPIGKTADEYLRELAYEGLRKKYGEITAEIKERADYELGIISKQGFSDYFLIVWDFIAYSESIGVPVGPGRGSGVGSIVAYAIGITKVDPLKYALIFERFLNAERISNPDFDIDFCVDGREKVIDYVINKYGAPNVSQIVTFGTLAAKAAVKDVGRVLNHPYSEVEKITKLIPVLPGKSKLADFLGLVELKDDEKPAVIAELKELYDTDENAKRILDYSMEIEGMPRQTGMHAAGVIICKDEVDKHVPLAKSGDDIITTQFNMVECEELGLLKMDFLGLRTLTDIRKALDIIEKSKKMDVDLYAAGYDDPEVFKLIASGDTHAVFQFESEGMKKFMRDLKPTTFEDIIAGVALYRPGPMDKIGEYVFNKKNPDKIKYDHPILKPILENTYGIMIYQEQVMEMVRKLAGYSLGRADIVRRIMSKKKKSEMEAERSVFLYGKTDSKGSVPGCIANGVPEATAQKVYDDMTSFASYAFNKSHAAAYAVLAYQTAYLKRYYTVEFIAAVLNNRITSIDEIRNYLQYLKEKNISVLPPNINKSYADFTVEDGAVRIGMAAIKNVGASVVELIVKQREENGEFKNFVEFVERMDNVTINKKMLESLIYAGTFDCFGLHRSQLIAVYESIIDRVTRDKQSKAKGQFSFFDMVEVKDDFKYPRLNEYPLSEKLKREREVSGVYLTGHPLDEHAAEMKKFEYNTAVIKNMIEDTETGNGNMDNKVVTLGGMLIEAEKRITKNGRELGIGKVEDLYGTMEVMLSSYKYNNLKHLWTSEKMITVTGKLSVKDDSVTLWADSISEWQQTKKTTTKKMCIYLSFSKAGTNFREKINEILKVHDGDDNIYLKNLDDGNLYPLETKASASNPLTNELWGVDGVEEIKIV